LVLSCLFFFFSSRRRHTRFSRDWSSDVCSSDLTELWPVAWPSPPSSKSLSPSSPGVNRMERDGLSALMYMPSGILPSVRTAMARSEERRVGKECRYRWKACSREREGGEYGDSGC